MTSGRQPSKPPTINVSYASNGCFVAPSNQVLNVAADPVAVAGWIKKSLMNNSFTHIIH